mmetsp:Transcript_592/g.770  ORF Transcript_592/g.770 Transcript_592/m.770 type:complete len:105 (-) Transcript_592:388-702(-)
MQSALAHFCTSPESLEKVRAEFDPFVKSAGGFEAAFKTELTYETCKDMTYLGYVISESLRYGNVATFTSMYIATQDTKIGWLNFKAGDTFLINLYGMAMNGNTW